MVINFLFSLQNKVQKQESIKKELETINAAFYCTLCDKQYTKISEYETHLSSYDHNHRKVIVPSY